jgi:serine/threonine-protein kinase
VGGAEIFQPGETFHGYGVERLLGRGGLGTVWLVRHQMLDTLFALKVLDPDVAEEKPEYVKRFVREAKLATRIRHPNLVSVHDAGYDADKGVYFLVMDYVNGDTLRKPIAFGGGMPEKEAVRIILQVVDVLAAAQRFGMVHRDLKPENIMLTSDGVVKLLDLGIAKVSGGLDSLKTSTNTVLGTPAYISPEQALDSSTVDSRADVYSLGIILFEMLCGRRPYLGDSPADVVEQLLDDNPIPDVRTFNSSISLKISTVISLMCAKHAKDRLASPQAVLDAFARIGYVVSSAAGAEFAAESDDMEEVPSMEQLVSELSTKKSDPSLTMETQDAEMQEFVSRLKQKRRHGLMLACIAAVLALAGVVAVVMLVCR